MIKIFRYSTLGNHNYGWLNAKYHFNFANYFNPSIKPVKPLLVWNDDTISPKTGFPMHSHDNMEIITYIRKGKITHKDNLGNSGEIESGQIQIMSAGSGITHSEYNNSEEVTKLFQIWIEPNTLNIRPKWENINIDNSNQQQIQILASGQNKYDKLKIPRINQDVSLVRIKGKRNSINYDLGYNRHMYFVLSYGKVKINNLVVNEGDGIHIDKINKFKIEFLEQSEIISVDMLNSKQKIS